MALLFTMAYTLRSPNMVGQPNCSSSSHDSTITFRVLPTLIMTTYLRNWLFAGGIPEAREPPTIETTSPQGSDDEDDEGSATETEQDKEDDDVAPAFPAINSAQRAISSRILSDSELMPPPPMPGLAVRTPGVPSSSSSRISSTSLFPPPKPGSSMLALPPSTTKPPPKPSKKKAKVALAPGHSPLDWAHLKSSGADLRVSQAPFHVWVYI